MRNLHYNNLNANVALNIGGTVIELDLVTLGRYLQRQRKSRGMTQGECAKAIHRSLPFYGHIERGTRKMSMETFCELVLALDLSADELLRAAIPRR